MPGECRSAGHATARRIGLALALPLAVAGCLVGSAPASAAALHALAPKGCITDLGGDGIGCAQTTQGLNLSYGVDVSPDGRNVYVAARNDGAIVTFDRASDGTLLNPRCISDVDNGADCGGASTQGLTGASQVVVSPDGENVYATGQFDNAIVTFDRAADGTLSNPSCISDVDNGSDCGGASAQGLYDAFGLAVSPDGASVYVASQSDHAIASFDRGQDGTLSNPSCISDTDVGVDCGGASAQGLQTAIDVTVSPDGSSVYALGSSDNAIVTFDRATDGALSNPSCISDGGDPAGCGAEADGLLLPRDVEVSPDGSTVYTISTGDDAVVRFDRAANGALSNPSCVSDVGDPAGCGAVAQGLAGGTGLALSPDGESAYVSATQDRAIVRFDRSRTGVLSDSSCISDLGDPAGCGATTEGLGGATLGARDVAVSPNGASVYVATASDDAIVTFARELAPVCHTSSSTGAPGAVQTVDLDCSDPNGDPITIEVDKGPAHGTLGAVNQGAKTVAYTPDPGFAGADSFAVEAHSDGKTSSPATVVIGVQPATGPPGGNGPRGATGPRGEVGPQGPPGRDATVKCKSKRHKVKCTVKFTAATSSTLVRARLAGHGRTYARAAKAIDGGSVKLALRTRRRLPAGRYRLKLTVLDRDGSRTRSERSLRIR